LGFRKNLGPKFHGQIARGKQVDMHPKQRFQFVLEAAEVEQCSAGQSIDQDVKIATVLIGTV